MLSFRALVRSIPRAVTRISAPAARNHTILHRHLTVLQSSWTRTAKPRFAAAFSTSRTAWASEGQVDEELAAKLESELQLEREMRDPDELPLSVKDYLDNSPYKIHDTPGKEEVVLTGQYGDENIRIVFSIADLNSLDQDADADKYDDRALYDEDGDDVDGAGLPSDGQSGGAQSKGAIATGRTKGGNINVAPEDSVAPADRDELADDESAGEEGEQEPSFPARVNVTVTKKGKKGALQIETIAQDGAIVIDNVYYYPDAKLADPKTAEQELARRDMYLGPPFGNLDEDLQVILERYLDERGVNTALALFVPDYVDYKEQREYVRWLNDVRNFVDDE
ncbi:MAG: hypothetical protein M1816_003752 [Peltula sp. TS41687]|nr:MAG: hypothetical protein M1816_003752 [Peltula sp. TS41687]